MHKGLYWSQLITGIGVGFIVAALIWISADQFNLEEVLFHQSTPVQSEREIVYYDSSVLDLEHAHLELPPDQEELDSEASIVVDDKNAEEVTHITDVAEENLVHNEESDNEVIEPVVVLPEPTDEVIAFIVDPGDTAEEIALRLERLGIASGKEFLHLVHVKNLERTLKSGHYEFKKGTLVTEIITRLIR